MFPSGTCMNWPLGGKVPAECSGEMLLVRRTEAVFPLTNAIDRRFQSHSVSRPSPDTAAMRTHLSL